VDKEVATVEKMDVDRAGGVVLPRLQVFGGDTVLSSAHDGHGNGEWRRVRSRAVGFVHGDIAAQSWQHEGQNLLVELAHERICKTSPHGFYKGAVGKPVQEFLFLVGQGGGRRGSDHQAFRRRYTGGDQPAG